MMHISRFLCGIISKHAKKCLALIDIVFLENHPNNKKIDEKFPLNQNNLVEMWKFSPQFFFKSQNVDNSFLINWKIMTRFALYFLLLPRCKISPIKNNNKIKIYIYRKFNHTCAWLSQNNWKIALNKIYHTTTKIFPRKNQNSPISILHNCFLLTISSSYIFFQSTFSR